MRSLQIGALCATALVFGYLVQAHGLEPPVDGAFGRAVRAIEEPETFPDYAFEERLPDGRTRDWGMVELRGRVIVAFFWATWCPNCRRELPELDALQARLGSEGVLVVALSQDGGGTETVAEYFRKHGVENLRVFHDSDQVLFSTLGLFGVPTAVIVDPQGRMVAVGQGDIPWNTEEAAAFLRQLKKS